MSVLLYAEETWAVVHKNITPLAVFQMNCLRRICGISLRDYVPNVDLSNRQNLFCGVSAAKTRAARSYFQEA